VTRDQVIATLKANLNKPVIVEFTDGVSGRITPLTVDKEGFIHDLASTDDTVFWVPFEEVASVTPEQAEPNPKSE
jgi:hypothetical protein